MSGGSRIIGWRGREPAEGGMVEELPGPLDLTEDFDAPVESAWGRVAAGLALALAVGWIALVTWLAWPQLLRGDGLAIAAFAASASTPIAVGGIGWLLLMRTSRSEAQRFGTTARAMRLEAARLERVVGTMARRLEDNRQALAEQTQQLAGLGEQTAARIGAVGSDVELQSAQFAASAERLERAGAAAATQLDRLLDAVPAAQAGTDAMADALARAGDGVIERVTALDSRLDAVIERSQAARGFADDAVGALGARLAEVANEGDRADTVVDRIERSVERITTGLIDADARLGVLQEIGVGRTRDLAASIGALGGSADAMTEALRVGDETAEAMIARAEQALTAIDAVAREIDETIPDALVRLDQRIGASRSVVAAAKPELLALVTAAESTHDAIAAIAEVIHDQRATLDQLSGSLADTLSTSKAKSDALGAMVEDTIGRAQAFARDAAPQLVDALLRVRDTANTAADRAREALAVVIPEAAAALEASSTAALKRATAASVERQVAALSEAAEVAVDAAQRASDRLTRQLVTIADTTAAVEARIDEARHERAVGEEDTIARRSALLLEAMNSHAIDLSDALAAETSDSAWAAYLKGDRGVFTRRAVRLLGAGAARDVASLYNADPGFRDLVNRYIHDFETMLRGVLASREGSPIGVTLLSSDMGKLYVALAQAIERLRA